MLNPLDNIVRFCAFIQYHNITEDNNPLLADGIINPMKTETLGSIFGIKDVYINDNKLFIKSPNSEKYIELHLKEYKLLYSGDYPTLNAFKLRTETLLDISNLQIETLTVTENPMYDEISVDRLISENKYIPKISLVGGRNDNEMKILTITPFRNNQTVLSLSCWAIYEIMISHKELKYYEESLVTLFKFERAIIPPIIYPLIFSIFLFTIIFVLFFILISFVTGVLIVATIDFGILIAIIYQLFLTDQVTLNNYDELFRRRMSTFKYNKDEQFSI